MRDDPQKIHPPPAVSLAPPAIPFSFAPCTSLANMRPYYARAKYLHHLARPNYITVPRRRAPLLQVVRAKIFIAYPSCISSSRALMCVEDAQLVPVVAQPH